MKFHKEGRTIISTTIIISAAALLAIWYFFDPIILGIAAPLLLIFLVLVMQFFRVPGRVVTTGDDLIVSPADGKVVAMEEVEESEHINGKRLQISIFMSPLNVHVNWFPISGVVSYFKYHPGKYLVAWHPKSSTENERTSICLRHASGAEIMVRQIAGAVARRIICYAKRDARAEQSSEMGFIKFGSRVDVLVPIDSEIRVKLDETVRGSQTVLAVLSKGAP